MPVWILIVIIAQFLNAVVSIVDKHIIASKKVSKPVVYAFYVSILSTLSIFIFILGLLPFNFENLNFPKIQNVSWPNFTLIFFSLVAGYAFFLAILNSYKALQKSDASDVVPVIGSVNAILTFVISFIFLNEILSRNFLYGFILLVLGTIILSHFRFTLRTLLYSLSSGLFFAIYFTSMKFMFEEFTFDQTFFWTRIGMLIVATSLLLLPNIHKIIFQGTKKEKIETGFWIIGNNILGGIAGIALLKATELGSVSVVQALNGLQFAFLILISILFGKITPLTFGENNKLSDIIQKVFSVSLIILGFYLLFI
jgi:drug/metabolite transporter (DMT)-like permease